MKPVKHTYRTLGIVAVAATAVVALFTLWFYRSESIDARLDKTRERLLRARKDSEPDSSLSPGALLRDLNEILDKKYKDDEPGKEERRRRLARDFAGAFTSQSFDYGQGSNVEVETTVLVNWKEYREHLTANPLENARLLSKYADALEELGRRDPAFVRSVRPRPDGTLEQTVPAKNSRDVHLFQKLSVGYDKHVDMLRSTPGPVNKEYLLAFLCQYRNATDNPSMTAHVFGYDQTQLRAEETRCADTRQSPKVFS